MSNPPRSASIRNARMRWRSVIVIALLAPLLLGYTFGDDATALLRELDLFGGIAREVISNYVERIDPTNLVKAGIKGMLGSLDPYSVYIDEQDKADVEMLTLGSYGGIGVTISDFNGHHVVSAFANETAKSATGLRIGDEVLRIDTMNVEGRSIDLKRYLRGLAGTMVQLTTRRPGIDSILSIPIERRDVQVRGVNFIEALDEGLLYIKLDRFTRSTGIELRAQLQRSLGESTVTGIVLDLRDNPGGLLDAAVEVSELFVPKGSLIVRTRGRQAQYTREFTSDSDPLSTAIPLAVLVNRGSASASEIVAGAMQDLDRAILVGETTYGKGLVQNVFSLGNNASLKLTTSKYYTPSGRCIQKNDYGKRGVDGVILSDPMDTVKTFRSLLLHRTLHGAGGIDPDIAIAPDSSSLILRSLTQNGALLSFVAATINTRRLTEVPPIDEAMRAALHARFDTAAAVLRPQAEVQYKALLLQLEREGFPKKTLQKATALGAALKDGRPDQLDASWEQLRAPLAAEFAMQLGGVRMRFLQTRHQDPVLLRAMRVLRNAAEYQSVMATGH